MNKNWYYFSAAVVLAGIIIHLPLLFVCGALLLLILALTDIWAKYCFHALHYQRQFSEERALFGEEITFSLQIENSKLLPLPWLEVEDLLPLSLSIEGENLRKRILSEQMRLECLFSPGWYERVTRRYSVRCFARGVHAFGPATVRSGDVFGFISREMELPERQYVLVYPLILPLSRFNLPARHPFGDKRAPRRLLEDPSRVIGTRDYIYGDSLRRVHWKATARTMQLQSKVYEATTTYTMEIFLNLDGRIDTHFGIHPELQELAICAAASVTDWAINEGYAVGLYANTILFMPEEVDLPQAMLNGEEEEADLEETVAAQVRRRRVHIPASSSVEQRRRIMEVLARVQPYFNSSIENIMQAERTRLPAGATIVLITSRISDQMLDILTRMRQGGHAVTILFAGDAAAPTQLADTKIYHLGGTDTWSAILQACSKGEEPAGLRF
ncbi:DUF58 domain-containing protein [Ktedonosporobacter rubrisoli]|uniref:DUF58 domain-containing protein n=1 Tax=Ktedonosporobacter rubrisoli TaxID=2509675 RepID=A0A4V0YZU9_KTERU|nr:DUF58 domain-containing protein [Ktedonosporobacter rubrisoli]QBD80981.1 DUF58 domain-containing protein [Ktedonosporobacter rubrisoli]